MKKIILSSGQPSIVDRGRSCQVPKLVLDTSATAKLSGCRSTSKIAKGEGTRVIANQLGQLASAGVVKSPYHLMLVRALHPDAKVLAGSYRFEKPASPGEVFDRLVHGDVVHYEVTIPEGSNIFDIAAIAGKIPFLNSVKMLAILKDPAPVRDLDPKAPTLEGYLFPSTYRLTRHSTEEQLAHMMLAEFRKIWKQSARPNAKRSRYCDARLETG